MRPAVDALAKHHRVITFSLCDERTSPFPCDPDRAFENYIAQVDLALDRAGVDRAVIAGVSYGGLIAAEFAARHPRSRQRRWCWRLRCTRRGSPIRGNSGISSRRC